MGQCRALGGESIVLGKVRVLVLVYLHRTWDNFAEYIIEFIGVCGLQRGISMMGEDGYHPVMDLVCSENLKPAWT